MGVIRRAVLGSLIVGAGAMALAKNKKTVIKMGKDVNKAAKKVLRNGSKHSKSVLKATKGAL